ncbi:MAG TPA: hypothetical protein VIY28_01435 [Pseudonocardiaceae bacterium]
MEPQLPELLLEPLAAPAASTQPLHPAHSGPQASPRRPRARRTPAGRHRNIAAVRTSRRSGHPPRWHAARRPLRVPRTRNGDHEIDFIVERDDHKVVALEVKLSSTVDDSDVIHLHWLRNHLGPNILDTAVITTGAYAYRCPGMT